MATNYQHRMELQRARDLVRENMVQGLKEDKRILQVNTWQRSASETQWRTQQAMAEQERRLEDSNRTQALQRRARMRRSEQEEKLAECIRDQKEREAGEAAKIALIIKNDGRLKELESKLKLAYINKARAVQLNEKSVYERQMKQRAAAMDYEMERQRAEEESKQANEALILVGKQQEQKDFLLKQMENKRTIIKQTAAEEYRRDKLNVDAVIDDVVREQHVEARQKIQKQEETRNFIRRYQVQHEEEKKEKEDAIKEEDRKIMEYHLAAEAREFAKVAKKKEKEAREEEVYQQILMQQDEIRRKQEEIVADRETLAMEEREIEMLAKDKDRIRAIQRMKAEMVEANEQQKQYKKQKIVEEGVYEEDIRRRMREAYEEADRKEARAEAMRTDEMRKHKMGIYQQREDRKVQYRLAKEREMEENRLHKEEEDFRERVVREAAKRILEQHKDVLTRFNPGDTNLKSFGL